MYPCERHWPPAGPRPGSDSSRSPPVPGPPRSNPASNDDRPWPSPWRVVRRSVMRLRSWLRMLGCPGGPPTDGDQPPWCSPPPAVDHRQTALSGPAEMDRPPPIKDLKIAKRLHPQGGCCPLLYGVTQVAQLLFHRLDGDRLANISAGVELKGLRHVLGNPVTKIRLPRGQSSFQPLGQGDAAIPGISISKKATSKPLRSLQPRQQPTGTGKGMDFPWGQACRIRSVSISSIRAFVIRRDDPHQKDSFPWVSPVLGIRTWATVPTPSWLAMQSVPPHWAVKRLRTFSIPHVLPVPTHPHRVKPHTSSRMVTW